MHPLCINSVFKVWLTSILSPSLEQHHKCALTCLKRLYMSTVNISLLTATEEDVCVCLHSQPLTPLARPAPHNLSPFRMSSLDVTRIAAHLCCSDTWVSTEDVWMKTAFGEFTVMGMYCRVFGLFYLLLLFGRSIHAVFLSVPRCIQCLRTAVWGNKWCTKYLVFSISV